MKQQRHVVEGTAYRAGREENRRQRKVNAEIDKQQESWRSDNQPLITTTTMKLDINGHIVEVERSLAYHLLHTQEARLCIDQSVPVDYIAEGAD